MRSKAKRNFFFTGVKVIIAALLIVLQVYPIFLCNHFQHEDNR